MEGYVVTYLLDTSVWLRGATEPSTIPERIKAVLGTPKETFALSVISLWEVAKKHQAGKLSLGMELEVWLAKAIASQIHILPLNSEVICDAMRLPNFPTRDPADELIVATARVHNLTLLTTDSLLKNYQHARIHYFAPVLE